PALVTAEPASALMMACDELVGRARSQVRRFHAMPPMSPPNTTQVSMALGSTSLSLMVLATPVPKRKTATKLKMAAQMTACQGVRARVVTTVAMELAASWNPFRKSNTSARTMMKRISVMLSAVFKQDGLDGAAEVIAGFDRVHEEIVNLALLHHFQRVGRTGVETGKKTGALATCFFFQAAEFVQRKAFGGFCVALTQPADGG